MDKNKILRAGVYCGVAGALLLVVMAVLGLPAGDAMGAAEMPAPPDIYVARIKPAAATLIRVLAVDNIFLIAYTGVFVAAAVLVWEKARTLGIIGLGFAVLTALLDIIENAVLIDLARTLLADLTVSPGRVSLLSVFTQVKFASAALAVAFFAMAILIDRPTRGSLDFGVAALFGLFPVVNAMAVANPALSLLVILWMLLMLLASAVLFRRASVRP
jgi:hypothetical protein